MKYINLKSISYQYLKKKLILEYEKHILNKLENSHQLVKLMLRYCNNER